MRYFSWEQLGKKPTPLESLISATKKEWYQAKHPKPSVEEVDFLNSVPVRECPFCHSAEVIRFGHNKVGIQKYKCRKCGRRFLPTTGTLFDSHKIPLSEWIEYTECVFQYQSLNSSAYDNRNARSTGKYWLSKVSAALKGWHSDTILKGTIYLDETYFSVIYSKRTKDENGKFKRGLSKEKICVICATDLRDTVIVRGRYGKPSSGEILEALKDRIEPGSLLVHDGENSHAALVKALNLREEVHTSDEIKKMEDDENPMNPINTVHRHLKKFMENHMGFARRELSAWLNVFRFIWTEDKDYSEMTRDLLDLMLNTHIVIRYCKKPRPRKQKNKAK